MNNDPDFYCSRQRVATFIQLTYITLNQFPSDFYHKNPGTIYSKDFLVKKVLQLPVWLTSFILCLYIFINVKSSLRWKFGGWFYLICTNSASIKMEVNLRIVSRWNWNVIPQSEVNQLLCPGGKFVLEIKVL